MEQNKKNMKKKGVSIIIENNNNEILLQKRDNKSGITYPGFWGLPGGSIEKGESPNNAIIREIKEETELKINKPTLIDEYTHNGKKEFVFFFKIKHIKILECKEGLEIKFIKKSDIKKLKIRPDDKNTLEKFLNKKINEKIVFFGRNLNYDLTLICFNLLVKFLKNKNHEIVLVVFSDDNHNKQRTLEYFAKKNNIPAIFAKNNNVNNLQFINKIEKFKPTLFITVQFPKIFSNLLLKIPRRGSFNMHRGWPLRGGAIDERAIFYQIPTYNIIIHHISEGIDTGNVIGKIGFKITKKDTGFSLNRKTNNASKKLFAKIFLPMIGNQIPIGIKQDLKKTIYASKNSLKNEINFECNASEIERLCRAFYHPRKEGAKFKVKNKKVFVIPPIKIEKIKQKLKPGTIISLKNTTKIMCGDKIVKIKYCNFENKKMVLLNKILLTEGLSENKIIG